MFAIACSALAGVCCVLLAPRLPTLAETCCLGAGALAIAIGLRSVWPLAILMGACVASLEGGARMADWLAPTLQRDKLEITGVVCSVPQSRPNGARFVFAPDPGAGPRLPRRVELTWYDADRLPLAAERWSLVVRLRRPRGFANPGGPDLAARLLRDGIGATGYVRHGVALPAATGDAWRWPVLRSRARVAGAIRASLGERPATGIVAGLAVGLQDALSVEQWRALSRTGTSHLMAISGLHIGMVAAAFAWLAGRIRRCGQRHGALGAARDASIICGAGAALVYSALAGASVPTQRTLIMIGVAALALHRRRNPGVLDGLATALLAVLAIDPLAPLAPGFWLSFCAVGVIVAVMSGYTMRQRVLASYLRTQLAVTIGLVPVLASVFGNVSLVSIPVNLVAIPLYTLVVVPWVLCGSVMAVADVSWGAAVLGPVAWLIESTWPMIEAPASWTIATWSMPAPGPWACALMILGVAAALAPLRMDARVAAVGIVACLCIRQPDAPPSGRVRVAVLDVGQGLAVVLQTRRHTMLYDAGPAFRSGSDAGQLVVLPYLYERGLRRLDALVVSHEDSDHAGGARSVLETMPVRERIASRDAPGPHGHVRRCHRNASWTWDGVTFAWLNGTPEPEERDNDRSCVLLVSAGTRRVLLPGDIEARAEGRLLAQVRQLHVDVVIIPHHGSRTSSTPEFVAATTPIWAVASVGHLNRWGLPRPEIVERWEAAGAHVLTTAESGAIELELGTGTLEGPRSHRSAQRRFWHDA